MDEAVDMSGAVNRSAVSRRTMLAAGAGSALLATMAGAGAGAGPVLAASASTRLLDPANSDDARRIVRKMRYRLDEGLMFWWIKGQYLADVDAELTPICGMNFGSLQEVRPLADGRFEIMQMELGFRTDLVTGKRMTSLKNPLTGETVPVPFNPIGPTRVQYSADAVPQVSRNLGGSELDFQPIPEHPVQMQDMMFLPFRAKSRVKTPGFSDRLINDIGMIYGPAAQALDPRVMSVDAWLHSTDITTFPRWMNMGDRHGSITLRGVGAKVMKIRDMPQDFLALLEAHDPSIIADPSAALRRPQATYKG